jgi:hypothetical protein
MTEAEVIATRAVADGCEDGFSGARGCPADWSCRSRESNSVPLFLIPPDSITCGTILAGTGGDGGGAGAGGWRDD